MKKFIAFSGGVESSTMCLLYGNMANAIFADTGFEHKLIYNRIDLVEKKVREFHKNNFEVFKIKNKLGTLPDYIKDKKFYPSFRSRFCTRLFKIEPIDNYLKSFEQEGVELFIGLNSDEEHQRTGNHGNLPFVKYRYPLIENRINRQLCEQILKKADLLPDFPAYMRRGGCIGCFYKSKSEYEAMVHLAPDEFDQVVDLEESIQDKRGTYYRIKDDMPPMREFRKNVLEQNLLFDPKDVFAVINDKTQCGVFCNR